MEIRAAFKQQFHACLEMLADCVDKCPEELWVSPNPRFSKGDETIYRPFWRIALHAAFFAQLYLGQDLEAFQPWPERPTGGIDLLGNEVDLEPFELPEHALPFSKKETLEYIAYIDSIVDSTVDGLDLESGETGFSWYKNMSKLSHELLNLRHVQGHVGQLSELLMARGIETDWISRG